LFHHTPTTPLYTLSLHDALPIFPTLRPWAASTCAASLFRIHPRPAPIPSLPSPSFECTPSQATIATALSPKKRSKPLPASLRSTASSPPHTVSLPRFSPIIPARWLSLAPPTIP